MPELEREKIESSLSKAYDLRKRIVHGAEYDRLFKDKMACCREDALEEGTVMNLRYFRTYEEVEKDMLMPFLGLGVIPGTEIRMNAIIKVLRCLPKKDYRTLRRKTDNDEFQWFIPLYKWLGEVYPFPANVFNEKSGVQNLKLKPYAKVIFLSPRLEEIDSDIAVAVIAQCG